GGAHDNLIGGPTARAGNAIDPNRDDGVLVGGGAGNAIRRNVIVGHDTGPGIELADDGNNDQPLPLLTAGPSGFSRLPIAGNLTSAPATTCTIEVFADSVCNPSGFGEGERFLFSTTVTTDEAGNGHFTFAVAIAVEPGQFVAGTATDPANNTSAFSQCVEV